MDRLRPWPWPGLVLCPLITAACCDVVEVAEPGGELSLGLGSSESASVLEETRDSRFLTLADLERLCLRGRSKVVPASSTAVSTPLPAMTTAKGLGPSTYPSIAT